MTGTSFHSKRIAKYFPNMPYDSMKLRFRQTPEPDILRQLERHVRNIFRSALSMGDYITYVERSLIEILGQRHYTSSLKRALLSQLYKTQSKLSPNFENISNSSTESRHLGRLTSLPQVHVTEKAKKTTKATKFNPPPRRYRKRASLASL